MRMKNFASTAIAGLGTFGMGMARMWQRASPADRKDFPQWMQDMGEWGKKKDVTKLTPDVTKPAQDVTKLSTDVTAPKVDVAKTPEAESFPIKEDNPIQLAASDSLKTPPADEYVDTANEIGMGDKPLDTTMPMGSTDLALQIPAGGTNMGIGEMP